MNSEGMEATLEHIERMLIAQQDLINLLLLSISQNNGPIAAELTNNLSGLALSERIKLTEEFTTVAQSAISALSCPDEIGFRSVLTQSSESPSRLTRDMLRALMHVVPADESQPQRDTALPCETSAPCEPDLQ